MLYLISVEKLILKIQLERVEIFVIYSKALSWNWKKFLHLAEKRFLFLLWRCQIASLFNYFKKVNKPSSCAFREVMKELQAPTANSCTVVDVALIANEKEPVSDLIEKADRRTRSKVLRKLCKQFWSQCYFRHRKSKIMFLNVGLLPS